MLSRTGKGITVSVYRNSELGDCTNGGISSAHEKLTIVGGDYSFPEIFEPNDSQPAVKVIQRNVFRFSFPIIVPLDAAENGHPYMHGGNFAWTCDSRFRQQISEQPIPIFDRREW